jgi:hypothetical protein
MLLELVRSDGVIYGTLPGGMLEGAITETRFEP